MTCTIANLLTSLPAACARRQDSTDAQLADVETLLKDRGCSAATDTEKALVADRLGSYDAADLLRLRAAKAKASPA